MLSVSEKYLQAIVADSRDMPYRVTLSGDEVYDGSKIPNMKLEESVSGVVGVTLGTANSATLKLTLRDADVIDYSDILVEPESGLVLPDGSIEWVPLGKFWVTEHSTSNDYKTVHLTCADGMYHMTGEYISQLTYPAHIRDVTHEIVSQAGVDFIEPSSWPEVMVRRKPEGLTLREAIGHAAGCCGSNARFNRYGKLEFVWYEDSGIVIERNSQYLDGMTRLNAKPLFVNFEVTGEVEKYTVTVITDSNGSVTATPGRDVLEGDVVVLSVNPFGNYEMATITAVTEQGVEVTLHKSADGGYTFVQPDSNVTVTASFRESANGPFKLTVFAHEGGFIGYMPSQHEKGNNYFKEGDEVTITLTPGEGMQLDKFVTTPGNLEIVQNKFIMPKSDVTITAYFKEQEEIFTPYSWLQAPPTPPTSKPYWAIFYKDDPNLPTCQKYYLVWFDSWTASIWNTAYDMNEYKIQFNGYYSCGSKNNGHGKHEWDCSVWTGNGDENSNFTWFAYCGFMWSGTENNRLDEQHCLIASNADLYRNGMRVFEANAELITAVQTDYMQNGMDVREKGSLSYWQCPDTFSTPLPAKNWMVLMPEGGLYMTMGEDGLWQDPIANLPATMIAFFYDTIEIQNIGAVDTPSSEEFYLAYVTNAHWAYMYPESLGWDVIHDLPEGAVIGFRNPLTTTESRFVYDNGNRYNFSGILATNRDLYVGNTLFMPRNDCRVCNCASVSPMKFALRRSTNTDAIVIDNDSMVVTTSNDAIIITSDLIEVTTSGDGIVISTKKPTTENVTITYTNPMIYEKMVEAISSVVKNVTYTPARVKHRGNPALQAGDMIRTPDRNGVYHNVLIVQQTMNFGGGMNSEIYCPGQTEKTSNFSANGPITAQIKKEIQQSNSVLERRVSTSNASVYAAIYKTIAASEAKINSVVEWQGVASNSLASLEQRATDNEASIGLVVESGEVRAGIIMEAINDDESAIKISADKLDIEGKKLDIKVDATNIDGKVTADHIDATDVDLQRATIGDWHLGPVTVYENAYVHEEAYAFYSDEIYDATRKVTYQIYLTPKGVYSLGRDETGATQYASKSWYDILNG